MKILKYVEHTINRNYPINHVIVDEILQNDLQEVYKSIIEIVKKYPKCNHISAMKQGEKIANEVTNGYGLYNLNMDTLRWGYYDVLYHYDSYEFGYNWHNNGNVRNYPKELENLYTDCLYSI